MLGLRFTFLQPHMKTWPTDGTIDWLWPAAERAGLPVALLAANFLPTVGQVAERHPRLKLIIDHLGRRSPAETARRRGTTCRRCSPSRRIPTSRSRRRARRAIRARPIRSATSTTSCAASTTPSARADVLGTDITRMPCSYRQCVTMFTEELPWLKGRDQELVMGRAVCDWIGWKLPQ